MEGVEEYGSSTVGGNVGMEEGYGNSDGMMMTSAGGNVG